MKSWQTLNLERKLGEADEPRRSLDLRSSSSAAEPRSSGPTQFPQREPSRASQLPAERRRLRLARRAIMLSWAVCLSLGVLLDRLSLGLWHLTRLVSH